MVFLHPERTDFAPVGLNGSQLSGEGQSILRDSGFGVQGISGSILGIFLLAISAQGNELGRWSDYLHRRIPNIDSN